MNKKTATYFSLFFIAILAVIYLLSASQYSNPTNTNSIDPGFFPTILSIALIILCLLSFFQTMLKKEANEKIPLPNLKLILMTIAITMLFFVSWSTLGYFYLQNFTFLLILFTLYTPKNNINKRVLLSNASIALGVTLIVYILFDVIIFINL